jgi:hypothetical protein
MPRRKKEDAIEFDSLKALREHMEVLLETFHEYIPVPRREFQAMLRRVGKAERELQGR